MLTPDSNDDYALFGATAQLGQAELTIDVGGFVRDIFVFEDRVYVAADRAGLVRLSRTGDRWFVDWSFRLPSGGANDREPAFAVTAWRTGGDLRVLVGTNDYANGGALYLFDPEALPGNELLDVRTTFVNPSNPTTSFNRDIWTIAHAYDLVTDPGTGQPSGEVTVLVGLGCDGGLQRFEFAPNATSIPSASATLLHPLGLPPSLGPCKPGEPNYPLHHPRNVRDVIIHHEPGVEQVAFVALRIEGVRAVDLSGGGLALLGSAVYTSANKVSYPTALAFDSIDKILFVGCGGYFAEERQVANRLTSVEPCGFPEPQSCLDGFHVYSWTTSSSSLVLEGSESSTVLLPNDSQPVAPVALSVRRRGFKEYQLDAASTANGLRAFEVVDESGGWSLEERGAMNQLDAILIVGTNEAFVQEGAVYISGEFCIGSFDPQAPSGLLAAPASVVFVEPANTLSGFGGANARLYTTGFAGTTILDVSGANRLMPLKGLNEIPRQGRGLAARTAPGMPPFSGPGGAENRWLIEVNYADFTTIPSGSTGGLHAYAVGIGTTYNRAEMPEVVSWIHRFDAQGAPLPNTSLRDLAVRALNTLEQVWYVSFSPKEEVIVGGVTYPAADSVGVLALRVAYEQIAGQSGWHYTVTLMSRVELENAQGVISATPDDFAGRVTYDSVRQLLYLGAGPKGVAVFDVGPDPFVPVQVGYRDLGGPGEIVSCYQCLADTEGRLIVTCAENGVAVFDDLTNITTGEVTLHVTRMVAIGIAPDPADTSGTKYVVCDSASVSKVVLS